MDDADQLERPATAPMAEAEDPGCARARILAAAEAQFATHGFHVTTMDRIARDARVSKKTVYKLFESKEDLFREIFFGLRARAVAVPVRHDLPPEAALSDFLLAIAAFIFADRSVALLRVAMTEAGQLALAPGQERGRQDRARLALEDYLDGLQAAGAHDFGCSGQEAAEMLFGMALGAFHHELMAGLETEVPETDLASRIGKAVRIFLRGSRVERD